MFNNRWKCLGTLCRCKPLKVIVILFLVCGFTGSPHSSVFAAKKAAAARKKMRRSPLPPRWAFGHIKSKDEFKGRLDILADVDWMEKNDIPCQIIHIDAAWSVGHNLFEFANAKVLHNILHPEIVGTVYDFSAPGENPYNADPNDILCRPTTPPPHVGQNLIDTLHGKGIKVTVWMTDRINMGTLGEDKKHHRGHPYGIGQFEGQGPREAALFKFAESQGFLRGELKDWHRGWGKRVDYNNPQALAWWHRMMDKVLDMGVDGFVLDGGAVLDYTTTTFNHLRAKKGDQAIMMSRSSREVAEVTLLTWAIDTKNDFSDKGIKYALEQVIKSSRVSTPYVTGTQSPRGPAPTEAFVCREVQFNAFCPTQFTFCYGDLSNPWDNGKTATKVFKYYTRLHNELIPYIYCAAILAHRTGEPIIRPAPGDLEYKFGGEFLVAPIYRDEMTRRVSFPAGDWIDYWDENKVYREGQEIEYDAPLDHIPLFVRAGAIIPMEVRKNWTGHGTENSAGALTLQIYPQNSEKCWFYEDCGDTLLRCTKKNDYLTPGDIHFELEGPARKYVLRFKTFISPQKVITGSAGVLPRRQAETDLTPDQAAWCYDEATRMTIIRFPETESEVLDLHISADKK
ncbi:MAG: hypothetical protein JSV03_11920 [Planctomycetota bacterium]|nr:MAG: hypothetical protein JSV03_11920 [Planctomycetota bacterium]